MKRFIKLLSVLLCLLCAVLLLAACSEKDKTEETTLGDTAVLETATQAETEPETTATETFPNEAESEGTKRY